jgi:NAD(P)-dependent dehydrogenase (short-subunit alcohol dehydrogenase family)
MPTLIMPEEEWTEILDTNLTGTLRACQIFGMHLLERGSGRIVNIASLNSFVALNEFTTYAAYTASKAGVVSLTRSIAVEGSRKGVTVGALRARRFQHGPECRLARQCPLRPGVADTDTDEPRGRASLLAGRQFCLDGEMDCLGSSLTGKSLLTGCHKRPVARPSRVWASVALIDCTRVDVAT